MKTQEVAVQAVLNIRLNSDTQNIDEVFVTAIGIKRSEKSLGYAVSSVGGEEITKARESNVVNALSGKVAGVRIGPVSYTHLLMVIKKTVQKMILALQVQMHSKNIIVS